LGEINEIKINELKQKRTQATRCNILVKRKVIRALVNTGAGPSAITDRLRRELNIPIAGKSNVSLTIANGKTIASLGVTNILIEINEDIGIDLKVEVIDSDERDLILGTDLLKYGIIDMKEGVLTIELDGEEYEIPIDFEGREKNKEYESRSDSESEYDTESEKDSSDEGENEYEENEKKELFSFVKTQVNNEEKKAKERVLAQERERR
jgi:hypothetical protein